MPYIYKEKSEQVKMKPGAPDTHKIAEILQKLLEPFASGHDIDYYYIDTDYIDDHLQNAVRLPEEDKQLLKDWLFTHFTQEELDGGFDISIGW